MKRILPLLALLVAALAVQAQPVSPCYMEKFDNGVALYNNHNYAAAKNSFVSSKSCPHPDTKKADEWIAKCEKALKKNEDAAYESCTSVEKCDSYLAKYPNGRYTAEVNAKKQKLQSEDAAYKSCSSVQKCEEYLNNYPNGRYVAEVREILQELQAEAKRNAEDEAYGKCTSVERCNDYLSLYPNGRYVAEVKQKRQNLQAEAGRKAEDEAYGKCKSVEKCNEYLSLYPNGRYVAEVKQKRQNLQAEADRKTEDEAYRNCKSVSQCVAYLQQYPQGRYVDKVEALRDSLGSCGIVKDYDGNQYKTVRIGKQCWMAENLRTEHYPDGKEIAAGFIFDNKLQCYKYKYSFGKGYFYFPNGLPIYAEEYGLLYNWEAARYKFEEGSANGNKKPSICPYGWHLPSWAEWQQLEKAVRDNPMYNYDNKPVVRKALASAYGWCKSDRDPMQVGNTQYANNVTGFNAPPAGSFERLSPHVKFFGNEAGFWSSTEDSEGLVMLFKINYYYAYPSSPIKDNTLKCRGHSVRCVRD